MADVLRAIALETPPNVATGRGVGRSLGALLATARAANRLRPLGIEGQRDLLEFFTRSAGDVLDQWFESDPIKAILGFDGIVGTYASPYAAGTAYVLLHHCFGEANGRKGAWGHAIGGMGAITQAMALAAWSAASRSARCRRRGNSDPQRPGDRGRHADRRTDRGARGRLQPPSETDLRKACRSGGVARGLSRTDRLVAQRVGRVSDERRALAELPSFACLPGRERAEHHGAGIVLAPSLAYMERAYFDARLHGWSSAPIVEMLIPSVLDDSLTPPGRHVASLFCQHVAPRLPGGRSWDEARETVADLMIDTVESYAPGFKASVIARTILTPLDLEREFGLVGGDIFHGCLSLDQLYSARPALGHADYRSPVPGLYMCGSSTHPGGGVSGLPGRNAARAIVTDFRRRKRPR